MNDELGKQVRASHELGEAIVRFVNATLNVHMKAEPPTPVQPSLPAPVQPPDDSEKEPLLVDTREATRLLSISRKTLYTHTTPRGSIPCVRLGSLVRYSLADLRQWLQNSKR
jgi:excisionase family DNA binding protein